MPSRRPCLGPGPFHLSEPGRSRCKAHEQTGYANAIPMNRGWPSLRARKLKADPLCEKCGALASTVDHIVARKFRGTDEWRNLMSLCPLHADQKNAADRARGRARAQALR